LQRLTLTATLIQNFRPDLAGIPRLVRDAEDNSNGEGEPDLLADLAPSFKVVRDALAPLAFLYDLRNYAGFAHAPNQGRAAAAAVQLGLPARNWHRRDFLLLLKKVADSVHLISEQLGTAAQIIRGQ
jgi:hypothetical protein